MKLLNRLTTIILENPVRLAVYSFFLYLSGCVMISIHLN